MCMYKTTITDLGDITESTAWRGNISARKMIDDGIVAPELLEDAVKKTDDYFVPADKRSDTRCIDGRCCGDEEKNHLGAQLPGGTPGAGLAYRLGIIRDHLELGNFCDDARFMLDAYEKAGIPPGDHRDNHGHGVGCGAIDKMSAALEAMIDPGLVADHERLTRALMGDRFQDEHYLHVMGAAVMVEGRADEYFKNRAESITTLEDRIHHAVPVLQGDHHECLVIINTMSGTTFDNKRFAEELGGMQAFNYDVWQTLEEAAMIFGAGSSNAERFVMARVMTAVATLMVLTDGTQKLIVRSGASKK